MPGERDGPQHAKRPVGETGRAAEQTLDGNEMSMLSIACDAPFCQDLPDPPILFWSASFHFFQAQQARRRGDRDAFWHHRRAFLLEQAEGYKGVTSG